MAKPKGTDTVYAELVKAARDMRTVTYGALAKTAGLAQPGIGSPLGYIRDEVCRPRGLPWLTVIAVSARGLPSGAYLPSDSTMSLEPDDQRIWWRAMALQVFATPWHEIACEPPRADK